MKSVKIKGLETIYGLMLSDNYRAINLMKKMGFTIEYLDDGTVKATVNLKEKIRKPECNAEKHGRNTIRAKRNRLAIKLTDDTGKTIQFSS